MRRHPVMGSRHVPRRRRPAIVVVCGVVFAAACFLGTAAYAQSASPQSAPPQSSPSKAEPAAREPSGRPTVVDAPPVSAQSAPLTAPVADAGLAVIPLEIVEGQRKVSDTITRIEAGIDKAGGSDDELLSSRAAAEDVQAEAQRLADALANRRLAIKDQIDKLGPSPTKDQPPEAVVAAQDRARLLGQLAEIDAQVNKIGIVQIRARQVIRRVQDLRHTIFTRDLMRRTRSPLDPSTWTEVAAEWPTASREMLSVGQSWWARIVERWQLALTALGSAAAVYIVLRWVFRRVVLRWQRMASGSGPSFFRRASVSGVLALAAAIPRLGAAVVAYGGGIAFDLFGTLTVQIAESALAAYAAYVVVAALASALLEPRLARWRLFRIDDDNARRVARLVKATAAVYALDRVAHDLIRQFYLSLPVSIAATFIASLAFAALLIGIVRTPMEGAATAKPDVQPAGPPADGPDAPIPNMSSPNALGISAGSSSALGISASSSNALKISAGSSNALGISANWLRVPLLALALVVIAASVLGYVALGRFIAGHVLLTGSGLTLMFLLHLAIRALAEQATVPATRIGRFLEHRVGFDVDRRGQVAAALAFVLNASLIAVGAPLLFMAWGFSGLDISRAAKAAVFGFEVGQFRISLARLAIAAALFIGLIFLTRMVQRWMQSRVFPAAKFDAGVAHSIETGVGYAGFAVAAMAAVSYAGFDVSNFAIVAGALSVGIGFGLQSIVNNFVSGLILLVERPVKVGDWIVVKDREGVVRNISVRSTEIETFDRSSLIVPNSELITGSVVNWTHRNSIGRVKIKVGVSYDADPEHVRRLLFAIAERNTHVLSHPKPQVVFEDLGASSMDFSLRVYLADIYDVLEVQTELRMAIVRTLRAEGIEIPNPQYDVRIRGALPEPSTIPRPSTEADAHASVDLQANHPVPIKLAR